MIENVVRKTLLVLLFLLFATSAIAFQSDVQQVCFSHNGKCTAAIVEQIDHAKSEIHIQAYSFTSLSIAKALISAHKRGVKIEAILDKLNETGKKRSIRLLTKTRLITKGLLLKAMT
jgi:phosphatidylserine/phosphatidylglycerophosphate/cardiolipin synthase-like enzyme